MSLAYGERQLRLSIKETAIMFGTTIDTLYYYERVGLINPERNGKNNYRVYRNEEVSRIGIIQSLADAGFSLPEIREYFDHRTFGSYVSMLRGGLQDIDRRISGLQRQQRLIQSALAVFAAALQDATNGEVVVANKKDRPYISLGTSHETYANYLENVVEKSRRKGVHFDICHVFDGYRLRRDPQSNELEATESMLYSPIPLGIEDGVMPGGTYLSYAFHGGMESGNAAFEKIQSYERENGWVADGPLLCFWLVDEWVTEREREALQVFQRKVKPAWPVCEAPVS